MLRLSYIRSEKRRILRRCLYAEIQPFRLPCFVSEASLSYIRQRVSKRQQLFTQMSDVRINQYLSMNFTHVQTTMVRDQYNQEMGKWPPPKISKSAVIWVLLVKSQNVTKKSAVIWVFLVKIQNQTKKSAVIWVFLVKSQNLTKLHS